MFSLNRFVKECERMAAQSDAAASIRALVESAISQPDSLREALPNFDGDESLLYASPILVAVHLRMTPNVHYPPHSHNMPVIVGIYAGSERNHSYELSDCGPVDVGQKDYSAGDVLVLSPDAIHSVANISDDYSYGLHVYVGDLIHQDRNIWDPDTNEAFPYSDERYFGLSRPYDESRPFNRPAVCYAHERTA